MRKKIYLINLFEFKKKRIFKKYAYYLQLRLMRFKILISSSLLIQFILSKCYQFNHFKNSYFEIKKENP